MIKHKIEYCDCCHCYITVCGECGMNTCSGSYGPWEKHKIGGEDIPECTSCPEAYDLIPSLYTLLNKSNLGELLKQP